MANIKPLPGYVLIEALEEEDKSSGGVYLPESSKDKPSKGKVIAVGKGITQGKIEIRRYNEDKGEEHWIWDEPPVKVGQITIYKKWVNETISDEGKEYIFVRFEDLLGIIEDDK